MRSSLDTEEKFRLLTAVCAALAALAALVMLAAWLIEPAGLAEARLDHLVSGPGTSLALLALASTLLLLAYRPAARSFRYAAAVAALLVLSYALVVLSQYILGWHWGLESLLPESAEEINGRPVNSTSPITAASLMLLGASLLQFTVRHRSSKTTVFALLFTMLAGLNALVINFAYLFGAPLLHNNKIIPMSMLSAALIILLTLALLAAAGQRYWPLSLFVGSTLRARLMRVFLPLTVIIVMVEGWVIHTVHYEKSPFNPALVSSVLALLFVVLSGLLVMRLVQVIGGSIDRAEAEQRLATLELKRSEERLRELFDGSPISIWEDDFSQAKEYIENLKLRGVKDLGKYFDENPDELIRCATMVRVIDVNQATLDMYEAENKEEMLSGLTRVFTEETLVCFKSNLIDICAGETNLEMEAVTQTLKGRRMDNLVKWTVLPGFEESLARVLISISDITDLKKKETDLRVKTRQLEASQKVACLGSWEWDIANDRITWSDELYRIFDLEPQAFAATYEAFLEMVHPDDREKLDRVVKTALAEKSNYHVDARVKRPDGTEWVMEALGEVVCDAEGNPVLMGGTAQDVTEKKKAERAYRLTQFTVDKSADAMFWMGEDARFFYANDAACSSLGYSREELLDLTVHDIDPRFPPEAWEAQWREVGEVGSSTFDSVHRRKDGETFPVEIIVNHIEFEGESYHCAIVRDVSERNRVEAELRASEQRYRDLFESAPDAIFLADPKTGVIVGANTAATELVRRPLEELIGLHQSELHPEEMDERSKDQFGRHIRETIEDGKVTPIEYEVIRSDGERVPVEIVAQMIHHEGKTVFQGTFRDISERELAKRQVERSEHYYNRIFSSIKDGISILDRDMCIQSVNSTIEEWFPFRLPLEGKKCYEVYHGRDELCEVCPVLQTFETGKSAYEVVPKRDESGKIDGWFDLYSFPMFNDETGELEGVIEYVRDITQQRQALEDLRGSEENYRTLFEKSPFALVIHNDEMIINANQAAASLMGAESPEEVIGSKVIDFVHPDYRERASTRMRAILDRETYIPALEEKFIKLDGSVIDVEVSGMTVTYQGTKVIQVTFQDITERKQLEEQLRQAQKMESIGTLAGGIAHDFNNYLTAIEGYIDLSLMDIPEDNPVRGELIEARRSADRAANLTRQLLLFSRREPMDLKPSDLSRIISDIRSMLDRLLGERYRVEVALKDSIWTIKADAGHMEQVIMNLVVNARDAMSEGGLISISTQNVLVDDEYAREHTDSTPGKYVCLEVKDEGTGMDKKTLSHIFDPFFSTKGGGEGTGLGLSVVYGIVSQHQGWIDVDSSPGRGTAFRVFVPAIPLERERDLTIQDSVDDLEGKGERVLLVEDEDAVRALANRLLSEHGYEVYAASDADEADRIFTKERGDFDLVFSDVVLPGEDGISFVGRLRRRKPELRVLLASGYSGDENNRIDIEKHGYYFMQKPYSLSDLMKVVKDILSN